MTKHLLKSIFLGIFLLLTSSFCFAQINVKDSTLQFYMIGAAGSAQWPQADMANRFGKSYSVGGFFQLKTKKNLLFSFDGDYITGNDVIEPFLMQNITTRDGAFIGSDGKFANVVVTEAGYDFTLRVGKIFSALGHNKNSGLLVSVGAGFIQHKIRIDDKDKTVEQLKGDYKKGYDRLTNGLLCRQLIAYQFFSNNRLVNFFIGAEFNEGFTASRRNFNFDTMEADTKARQDFLFGIKAGWIIPFYPRNKNIFYYK